MDVEQQQARARWVYKPFDQTQLDAVSKKFYVDSMEALNKAHIPFLVGGAYAFAHYADIERHTKDFDIFVRAVDAERVLECLQTSLHTKVDRTFPHWLFKAIQGPNFIDIIFSSGNAVAIVDDAWFDRAPKAKILGVDALLIPAEEMIWSKGFIMERERFDGADVAHVIRGYGNKIDWEKLISRYGSNWRVLYTHVVLFGFIYPAELQTIPSWVVEKLSQQLVKEQTEAQPSTPLPSASTASSTSSAPLPPTTAPFRLCQGTLLSRQQYLKDVAEWLYTDARVHTYKEGIKPYMSDDDVAHWTAAAFNGTT